jgi:ABC-type spermidine/putrescine transport system permease subunit II
MSATAVDVREPAEPAAPVVRPRRRWGIIALGTFAWLVIIYSIAPIGVMVAYSFNQATAGGKLTFAWLGFTTDAYRYVFAISDLTDALVHSLEVATIATIGAVLVRARIQGLDRSIEKASYDLGAGPWATFSLVTLPLIWPGIVAGALLAFVLSIDDFIITSFVAGQTLTFPLWVYGAVKTGIPPQVFAMGTLVFAGGIVLAGLNALWQRRQPA